MLSVLMHSQSVKNHETKKDEAIEKISYVKVWE